VDLFHYTDPKVLLCVTVLQRLAEGPVGGRHKLRPSLLESIPTDPAPDVPQLLLAPEEPGGVVGEVFHEIMHAIGLPAATTDLQALGHWPEFLEPSWEALNPMFQHKAYARASAALHDQASRLVDLLPHKIDPSVFAANPQVMADMARIVGTLHEPWLRLSLFVAALKVSLDGPQEGLDSPYPVEWEEPPVDQLELS